MPAHGGKLELLRPHLGEQFEVVVRNSEGVPVVREFARAAATGRPARFLAVAEVIGFDLSRRGRASGVGARRGACGGVADQAEPWGAVLLAWRCTPSALAGGVAFVLAIWTISLLRFEHVLYAAQLAASPRRAAEGKLWLLLTSGLIATRPAVLALAWFALLAAAALLVSAAPIFWATTLLGHIGATGMA